MELQRNGDSMLSLRLSDMLVNHGLQEGLMLRLMLACSDPSSAGKLQWKWYRETWVCKKTQLCVTDRYQL